MQYYIQQGELPLKPACNPVQMVHVCNTFFMWVLSISTNKLYQPTVEGPYSLQMNIPRDPHLSSYGADDSVRDWLTDMAQAHLHHPAHEGRIILSIPQRHLVYNLYEDDFKAGTKFRFPTNKNE